MPGNEHRPHHVGVAAQGRNGDKGSNFFLFPIIFFEPDGTGPPEAGGCVSIRLKFFWFFLFTTDAASEGNANIVCKLPSGEEENERSEVKKNSSRRDRARPARDCWSRKSFKATCALDKISASARTKNGAIVSVLIARLGKSCQNVPAHFDDFPLKTGRAGNLYSRACAIHLYSANRRNS